MPSVTNQTASSALRGENPTVTLNASDATNVLPTLTVGQKCTISSSSKVGYISEIPFNGNIFLVRPVDMGAKFDSTSPGILAAAETITIL